MRNVALAISAVLLTGCAPSPPEETSVQSAAAVMLEVRPGLPLDSLLYMLDNLLLRSLSGRLEGESVIDFRRAEALTDRLLEASLPFEWIPDQQYSLESRLRQIQSAADRILAQVETGAPREPMLAELRTLRNDVVGLRETIARGGTRAPPPIERLLRFGDTTAAAGTAGPPAAPGPGPPAGPQPLGTPRPDTPDTTSP